MTGSQTAEDLTRSLEAQRQQVLMSLRSHPANGRLVINISSDISRWENTSADIELRAGDTLVIPKRPDFVLASGQVYNPVAIGYVPGKKFGWYFHKAGGATSSGNKKQIYVLRADGSVVPMSNSWSGKGFKDLRMRPGDTIFVPEKIVGASQLWQNMVGTAQILSAIVLPLALTGVL
jgi:protein involved in polysaccharide export with SLBB domain